MPRKPKPKSRPKPTNDIMDEVFQPGTAVEISSDDVGFRGSWYTGTVIRQASSKNNAQKKYLVEYAHLFDDEAGTKPLRETVRWEQLRPPAPREKEREFKLGEEVDAFYNDGWWEGVITQVKGNKFDVYFRASKDQIEFSRGDLRLHREWMGGEWKPPMEGGVETETETENEQLSTNSKTEEEPDKATTEKLFCKGALVEVCSDEDGFQGAWFAATIAEPMGKDKYLIQYQSLRTDDDKEFLKEEIDTKYIRPSPPDTYVVDSFSKLDEVDALYNDAWWVGVISRVLTNSRYIVYFKHTNEELEFEHAELRLHQDWIDGKWVAASQGFKL